MDIELGAKYRTEAQRVLRGAWNVFGAGLLAYFRTPGVGADLLLWSRESKIPSFQAFSRHLHGRDPSPILK